jgi:hypothetical protein
MVDMRPSHGEVVAIGAKGIDAEEVLDCADVGGGETFDWVLSGGPEETKSITRARGMLGTSND